MAGYKAGNLTLELFGIDRGAEKAITNVVNKLNLLQRSLNVFRNVNATAVGKNLSASFYNIGKALGAINENDINKLSSLAKATNYIQRFLTVVQKSDSRQVYGKLNSLFRALSSSVNSIDQTTLSNITAVSSALSTLGRFSTKMTKLDFSKTETGFKNLALAIQPFLEKVKEAESGLSSLYGILQKSSGKKIQGLLDGGDKGNRKGGLFGFAKLGVNIYMMRRLGGFVANLVQAGSDYNETLNLWQVAMRNNLDVADQFVNKMQKAYGISTKTLMNAQAVFKNMIGSLGQISDATAYALSEALVQMSADYASLYNRTLESAFQNMQSMLAGQVRPIRSAGLDMTETTLYQYYQQLGGTKSMRQLNRTEKQLLSILAVYQQMGSAGALGDMTKTLNQFANQSRMMTEYWAELKTWSGLLLKDLIDQSGMLVYINALLITTTEIIKAIAKSRGVGDENYLTDLLETTDATNDAVDELQGKLLDFDKFRSLEGQSASNFAIDEKLIKAITGYSSKIDQARNASQLIAGEWLKILGFTKDTNGEWGISEERLSAIANAFKSIGIAIGIIVGLKFIPWLFKVATNAIYAGHGFNVLGYAILGGAVYAILQAIDAFDRAEYWGGVLYSVFGVALVGAFIALNKQMLITAGSKIIAFFQTLQLQGALAVTTMQKMQVVMSYVGVAVMAAAGAFMIFDAIISGLEGNAKRTVSIISIVVGSLATLLGVILAIKGGLKGGLLGASIAGLGVGVLLAGIKGVASKEAQSLNNIPNYEMGASDIDSGTVFRAGEFGKTEAVYTGSNGKTNVANIQQMKAAELQALNEWWARAKNDIPAFQGVSDSGIYTIVDGEAKRRGKRFANA